MSLYYNTTTTSITELPKVTENISGFDKLDNESLATYGWYPFVDTEPPIHTEFDELTTSISIQDGVAVREWTITTKSIQDINAIVAVAKAAKITEINAARDAEEAAGFDYLGKRFDADAQAIKRLYGAVMAAQLSISAGTSPTDYFIDWTTSDGSVISLTYEQTTMIPAVMATTANTLHVKARQLKEQILAAPYEELSTIVW